MKSLKNLNSIDVDEAKVRVHTTGNEGVGPVGNVRHDNDHDPDNEAGSLASAIDSPRGDRFGMRARSTLRMEEGG